MSATDPELAALYEKKKQLLGLKGHYTTEELEEAFHHRTSGLYIGDAVFGAIDGTVTTFAVVAGSTGAGLAPGVIVILGLANLAADGLSMGLGNYLGKKSEREYNLAQRHKEEWEIENLRGIEVAELRNVFTRYGFRDADLDRAVEIVTRDKKTWVDLMMVEELGILEHARGSPAKHGLATFLAFAVAGSGPLLPYLFGADGTVAFQASIGLTATLLFAIGAMRAKITPRAWWRAGLEMLLVGAVAAMAAYFVGDLIERWLS